MSRASFATCAARYGYREIRTPILELTELFKRTAGEATDIVSKEMFTFIREGSDRSLTLKPEGTAPVARACIQAGLLTDNPVLKMYYIGQNFRYERGQKGRYRQHQQLGVEAFGAEDPAIDAEVITLAMDVLPRAGHHRDGTARQLGRHARIARGLQRGAARLCAPVSCPK